MIRGAKAIVLDSTGHVLIVRRSKTHPHVPLTNDLPGGKVEDGETMLEGLARELREETGLDTSNASVSLINSNEVHDFFSEDYRVELYEVKFNHRPDITLSFEHDEYKWMPLKDATILGELFEPMFEAYKTKAAN